MNSPTSNRAAISPRTWLVLAAAIVSGLALAQAPVDREKAKEGEPARVAFSMLPSNHMLVRATLNGKGPYRLIFDLGAPITLLSNKAAEESGTVKNDAPRSFLFSMRGEAEVAEMKVGELTAEKLPVVVFDHPALKVLGQVLGQPVDGIIGFTFFARYKTTIDYQINEMTFEPVDFEVRDLMRDLPDRLAGPKVARRVVVSPVGLWGIRLGPAEGGLSSPGTPVARVLDDSPAQAAGLQAGDVLTTIDGRWTTSPADVYEAAAAVAPGQSVAVGVLRDGEERVIPIRPADGA